MIISNEVDEFLKKRLVFDSASSGYLLIGEINGEILSDFLKKQGEVCFFTGNGGLDEIRNLKEAASKRIAGQNIFYVLNTKNLGYFSFPALLKIIEDAPPGRHFILLAKNSDAVPDTLRSRLSEIHISSNGPEQKNINQFAAAGESDRSRLIEQFTSDSETFGLFLDEAEIWAGDKRDPALMTRLQRVRENSLVLNISRKMCLEYLSQFI
ncbi:MAG: hypothetical protein AAB474_01125 [Patescibacteria group bacterium]